MPAKPPRFGTYYWSNLKNSKRYILYRCNCCKKRALFDPADLIKLYGDQDAMVPAFACSTCGNARHIDIGFLDPALGDYGHLTIRRLGKVKQVQTWITTKLGD